MPQITDTTPSLIAW